MLPLARSWPLWLNLGCLICKMNNIYPPYGVVTRIRWHNIAWVLVCDKCLINVSCVVKSCSVEERLIHSSHRCCKCLYRYVIKPETLLHEGCKSVYPTCGRAVSSSSLVEVCATYSLERRMVVTGFWWRTIQLSFEEWDTTKWINIEERAFLAERAEAWENTESEGNCMWFCCCQNAGSL